MSDALTEQAAGCFLGKSIGGSLGMLYEGRREFLDLEYYRPLPEHSAANDDLDLQLVWLDAVKRCGLAVDRQVLARAWLNHIDVHCSEYGIALWNLKRGVEPPVSGIHNNSFTCGMGAAIRSEIWATLFAGEPATAAHYAYEDACVDHAGEGILAEVFLAAFQSHLYKSRNMKASLDYAMAMLPSTSTLKNALETVAAWHREGRPYEETREAVMRRYGAVDFTDCVMNLCFILTGLLYGEGDFEKSILCAVNCGQDTDCTAATTGACLGIALGAGGIPDRWSRPMGDGIAMGDYIRGITPPSTLSELVETILRLRNSFDGLPRPAVEVPCPLEDVKDFSDENPWRINGKWIAAPGIRIPVARYVESDGRPPTLEAFIRSTEAQDAQVMICSEGQFEFRFDGKLLGAWGAREKPLPAFHLVQGGRCFNVHLEKGSAHSLRIDLLPNSVVSDVIVAFGDARNRHLTNVAYVRDGTDLSGSRHERALDPVIP